MKKISFLTALYLAISISVSAEQLYVNGKKGNDANPGTQSQPIRTLQEAARRVNMNAKKEATTVILSAGVHLLTETVLFNNNKYTTDNRLVIRAEIMPDDADWTPQQMPVLVLVAPTIPDGDGEETRGIDIEVNHATIEGLRFTGGPEYYYIDGKHNRRAYPVWRDGNSLDDLLVTQCMFTGDADILPVRVAVIAKGHGLVVDHCVFYHCQNPVVFWDAEGEISRRNAMRYCLVYGCYYSGMWTTKNTAEDFEFHHNIITGCGTAWMKEGDTHYKASNSIFSENKNQAAITSDVSNQKTPTPFSFLQMNNVQMTGTIEIERDQSKNNWLQLKTGSPGMELKAGLFKK